MDLVSFGIVYNREDDGAGDVHAHDVFLIMWDGRQIHVHNFSGVTSYDVGHQHRYAGTTDPAPNGVPHTHRYVTITSLDDGHTHTLRGITGPDIPLPTGGHYHLFQGVTTVNGRTPHKHSYSGRTSTS
ncbi:YmaF family protein [Tumebacillus lipolyticus]|uniref:YmaF family protein n=1 Tax=Tumebacillus lipolyticus TaxID=1280370 RepID=A0ABW4ZZH9_9BACL